SRVHDRLRAGDELAVLPVRTQHPGARDLPRVGEHVGGAVHDPPRLEDHPNGRPPHLLGSDRHQVPFALLRSAGGCLDLQISHKRSGFTGRRAFPSEHDHRRKRVCPLVFVGAFTSVLVVDTDPRNLPARPYPHRIPHRGIVPEGRYCTLTCGISDDFGGMTTLALERSSAYARRNSRSVHILTQVQVLKDQNGYRDLRAAVLIVRRVKVRNLWQAIPPWSASRLWRLVGTVAPDAEDHNDVLART